MSEERPTMRLRKLLSRTDRVLVMLHPPTAAHARIMEAAGVEALFVGTGAVVGAYTGLADVGVASMTECVTIAGWIASSVTIPVMLDGDTGHGGIMAVRRLVGECIRAGIAGVRLDDQSGETKRGTQTAGIEVAPLEVVLARYRAAVDMRDELDRDFVIMAQSYARDAANGGFDEFLRRIKVYKEQAKVDWVQFESPHSIEEIRQARAAVAGTFSAQKGKLPRILSLKEHLELGLNVAWYSGFGTAVTYAALWDFLQDFQRRDLAAWEDYCAAHKDNPYLRGARGAVPEGREKQRELEERYFPNEMLQKYRGPYEKG
jgi:2-methylisocitrate lyase-like PEP mutase family enzyme